MLSNRTELQRQVNIEQDKQTKKLFAISLHFSTKGKDSILTQQKNPPVAEVIRNKLRVQFQEE
jgi:hypothetical protein